MSETYNLKQKSNNEEQTAQVDLTDKANQVIKDKIKMIIIQNTYGETAINVHHVAQISYVKFKKKQNTNYMVAEVKQPSYQLEIVCHNGQKYNKRYDNYDECKKMFNDLLDFIQSDNIEDNNFYLEI
jgi:hypothetical protein